MSAKLMRGAFPVPASVQPGWRIIFQPRYDGFPARIKLPVNIRRLTSHHPYCEIGFSQQGMAGQRY